MYKIIYNSKVVDVVSNPTFIRFLPTGYIAIVDKTSAQGIVGSDGKTIYSFVDNKRADINTVSIESISNEEFNRLKNLLNSGTEISTDTSALIKAQHLAIQQLSDTCKNKITAGFSIILSNNTRYHFKLTTEDQLNLMMIENKILSGDSTFVYHATNRPCEIFTKDDMVKVISAFKKHTLYHTTYFNAAKQYILSLVDLEKVKAFTYGIDISDTVKNNAIRQILINGGV